MRTLLLLPLVAAALLGAPAITLAQPPAKAEASVAPRPGDLFVALTFKGETDAAWAGLTKLGYRGAGELRVMKALPNGKRACVAVFQGWLPQGALAAARKVPGVEAVSPVPPPAR